MRRLKRKIKWSLLNFFYRKLWVRIAIILLTIVTIPVVTLGILLIHTSQEAVRGSVLNNYKQIVVRTAEEIGLFVKRPQDILAAAAAMLGVVYPDSWKQETVLVELILDQPIFMKASTIDLSGEELTSSELGREGKRSYSREVVEGVESGMICMSEVKILDNPTPFVIMAVPIKKMGTIVGALIGDVNLRGMWEVVDSIKIGKTGRVFLVSNDGTLIAHEDKKRVLRNENLKGQKEVQSVLAGRAEAIELEDKREGKLISAYAPIAGLGWGVVLRQKQDEAYLFSKVMKLQSWIIIVLSELMAILVSIFMGKVLASPIKALASRIKKVASGDFDHKIKMRMRDDMGELIRSFNEMTKKLKRAKERERLSAIGEAVAWITHELKNSLIAIKSFVQLFPTRYKDEKFVNKFSRLIPGEIDRLEGMFKELSDFSSHADLRITKTNVKEIIAGILEIMKEEFVEKRIDVKYDPRDGNFYIDADAERLRQVFMNLTINSINAMPGGGSLIVSIDLVSSKVLSGPAHIEAKITDTGKGMPREILDKLFEPFHSTKNSGMGLGLAISRKIVEQHGGNIYVESEAEKGTTFVVKLPISRGC